jgi:hypothetical protein
MNERQNFDESMNLNHNFDKSMNEKHNFDESFQLGLFDEFKKDIFYITLSVDQTHLTFGVIIFS